MTRGRLVIVDLLLIMSRHRSTLPRSTCYLLGECWRSYHATMVGSDADQHQRRCMMTGPHGPILDAEPGIPSRPDQRSRKSENGNVLRQRPAAVRPEKWRHAIDTRAARCHLCRNDTYLAGALFRRHHGGREHTAAFGHAAGP